jgi:hypothetical protein
MSKPILLIVTSSHCGNCVRFIQNQEAATLEMLKNENKVTVVQIHDGKLKDQIRINRHINKYISYVPAFILITRESWDSDNEPEGIIMNQIMGRQTDRGFVKTERGKIEHLATFDGIKDWLNKELSTNPKFNKGIPSTPQFNSSLPSFRSVPLKTNSTNSHSSYRKYDSDSDSDSF